MKPPLLILACGNPSRGDDAIGPLLAEKLAAWLQKIGLAGQVEVICDLQFNIEHATDLEGRSHVLFIDAACELATPCEYGNLRPRRDETLSTHASSPAGLLWAASSILGLPLPRTELLQVSARDFELGAEISPHARRAMAAAWVYVRNWCLSHCRETSHA